MTDEQIIEKINIALDNVAGFFDSVNVVPDSYKKMAEQSGTTDKFFYRNLWLNEKNHRYKPNQNMFSFNADEVDKYKIPSWVVGCSGRANLFVKYAVESGLKPEDICIIPCVRISTIGAPHMDGHQIVAVKMSNGWQLINENRRDMSSARIDIGQRKVVQDIDSLVGQDIDALNNGEKFRVAAVMSPEEHLQINSAEKLQDVYAMKGHKFKQGTRQIKGNFLNNVRMFENQND